MQQQKNSEQAVQGIKKLSTLMAAAFASTFAGASQAYETQVGSTTVQVYGYAKLDFIHDVDADLGNLITHSSIRVDDEDGSEGHTDLHAFQSRIGFSTSTPLNGSVLNTRIEGDFYGSGGGSLRLRHAYGEWNNILAGQTWTNFGGPLGSTSTIDFAGQPGQANISRQAQLRYTYGGLSVALEDPGTLGGNVDSDTLPNEELEDELQSGLPDLTARYQSEAGIINYAASAVLRELKYYNAADDDDKTALGWGLNVEAKAQLTDRVSVQGSLTHGDGIGGYMYLTPGAAGFIDSSGDVETIKGTGGTLGVSVAAGPGAINFAYGIATVDLDDAVAEQAYDAGIDELDEVYDTTYLNYIWSPAKYVTYGLEASYATRETYNDDDGDALRFQGMVMYSF